jgi:hypothetical protein
MASATQEVRREADAVSALSALSAVKWSAGYTAAAAPGGAAEYEPPIARCEVVAPLACGEVACGELAAAVAPAEAQPPTVPQIPAIHDVMRSEVVDALKRKLIEVEGERQNAVRKAGLLEQELAVEKREHQRTTVKLKQMMAKRCANGAPEPAHESELASLRRAVAMLQQELAARVPPGGRNAAPSAAAHGFPLKRDPSHASLQNATPRLQRPRHADPSAAAGADAAPPAPGGAGSVIPRGEGTGADNPAGGSEVPAAEAGAAAPIGMVRSVSTTLRTPHGYVDGAICVESPRRQRVRTSSAMPRSASTLGISRSLSGIVLARSPTAPAIALHPTSAPDKKV